MDNFQIQAHGGLYSEGLIIGGIFAGGAYTWRGLFSECYGITKKIILVLTQVRSNFYLRNIKCLVLCLE